MTSQRPSRPLTVDTGSRTCGDRQRVHGRLHPMDDVKPSRAVRWLIIVAAGGALWLLIAVMATRGHL